MTISTPLVELELYEVCNPSFNDMNIEQQCAVAVNDWVAEDSEGRQFFGRTASEARRAALRFYGESWSKV